MAENTKDNKPTKEEYLQALQKEIKKCKTVDELSALIKKVSVKAKKVRTINFYTFDKKEIFKTCKVTKSTLYEDLYFMSILDTGSFGSVIVNEVAFAIFEQEPPAIKLADTLVFPMVKILTNGCIYLKELNKK